MEPPAPAPEVATVVDKVGSEAPALPAFQSVDARPGVPFRSVMPFGTAYANLHSNGQVGEIGLYQNGLIHGPYCKMDAVGRVTEIGVMRNGTVLLSFTPTQNYYLQQAVPSQQLVPLRR